MGEYRIVDDPTDVVALRHGMVVSKRQPSSR
jgi:hypothetical protein